MKKLYRFHTSVDGNILYTTDESAKHPHMQNDAKIEVKLTKKNIIDYILNTQQEPLYTVTELRQMKKEQLFKLAALE